MAARGPKGKAALSVVRTVAFDGRPKPPDDLTDSQKDIWIRIVASEPAEQFKTVALQMLLVEFCRHVDSARVLARLIEEFEPDWLMEDEGLLRYKDLLTMREKETRALADKATKLRLTNQSRYTPGAAATASKHAVPSAKPWERHS